MMSGSEHGVAYDGYEPDNKQHWRRLTLAVLACIVGASLLFSSSGKAGLLNTSSAPATLGLAEEDGCGCTSKKNEAESKCPPACIPFTGGCDSPWAHGTCITTAKVNEKACFVNCAKNKAQQAAKDTIDSAKDTIDSVKGAAGDAAKGATDSVNSVVNQAKDHVQSAKDSVGSAAKTATDTLASVSDEIKSRGKCIAALKPCITKCGINVPSEGKDGATESALQNIDTKDLTDSAKKCATNCYDVYEDCVPNDE